MYKCLTLNIAVVDFFVVSNEIPEQPVVSPVSGAIFEKRLIEKYINENGCDPINNESLDISQLIEIKGEIHSFNSFHY